MSKHTNILVPHHGQAASNSLDSLLIPSPDFRDLVFKFDISLANTIYQLVTLVKEPPYHHRADGAKRRSAPRR